MFPLKQDLDLTHRVVLTKWNLGGDVGAANVNKPPQVKQFIYIFIEVFILSPLLTKEKLSVVWLVHNICVAHMTSDISVLWFRFL